NHCPVRPLQVASFERVSLRSALLHCVGQPLPIRRPVHATETFVFFQRKDFPWVFSLAVHHPDFTNLALGSGLGSEDDVRAIRRDFPSRCALAELVYRLPEYGGRPDAIVPARFPGVGEQLSAVGKPRCDTPPATGGNAGRLRDNPLFTGRSEEHTSELQSRGHLVCRL